jgi:hypothetical protein
MRPAGDAFCWAGYLAMDICFGAGCGADRRQLLCGGFGE